MKTYPYEELFLVTDLPNVICYIIADYADTRLDTAIKEYKGVYDDVPLLMAFEAMNGALYFPHKLLNYLFHIDCYHNMLEEREMREIVLSERGNILHETENTEIYISEARDFWEEFYRHNDL